LLHAAVRLDFGYAPGRCLTVTEFRIYYGDGSVVRGRAPDDWARAPVDDVQVVVLMEPYPDGRRPWAGVDDRQLWTGEDRYNPFGWGPKFGRWMERAAYDAIWERARADA
jgi:hypothetical protein